MSRFGKPLSLIFCLASALPVAAGLQSPNLVEVQTATYVGGAGTEWLTDAAFPGEDILIAGTTLDPDLELRGVEATVLGKDAAPRPGPTQFTRLGVKDTGKIAVPELDDGGLDLPDDGELDLDFSLDREPSKQELKEREEANQQKLASVPRRFHFYLGDDVEQKDAYVRLSGAEPTATGFIARFDPTLREVRQLVRLPRRAGSITSIALGKDGSVYIAGGAGESIANLAADRRTETTDAVSGPNTNASPYDHVYIAKLSADLSTVHWVRDVKAQTFIPKLTALDSGNIVMIGPAYLRYTPEGELAQATKMPHDRVASGSAVDPVTGRYSRVGDWMSPTGREPWRCPRLVIHEPDGAIDKYLHGWRGPFFSPHYFHLVADSAVRRSAYDAAGNLYFSTWSHGGNNPMARYPYDPERMMPNAMGMPGSSTYCFITKLDPDHNVITSTLWTSAGSVNTLAAAVDQSVFFVGRGGINPDLPNTLARDGGDLLVLTEPNMAKLRFISAMPNVGDRVAAGGGDEMLSPIWLASGTVAGKPVAVAVSGAKPEGDSGPPLKAPVQGEFGGGLMDGYAVLLDLTPKTGLAYELPEREREPREHKPYDGPPLLWPTEGQVWQIGTEEPHTVKVTFRDTTDEKWPSFFSGRGVPGGTFTYGEESASADFTLDAPHMLQVEGRQHQRLLGELIEPGVGHPKVKVCFTDMQPWQRTDRAYDHNRFPVAVTKVSGVLAFDGKEIPFKDARCQGIWRYPWRDKARTWPAPNTAFGEAHFKVHGRDLGLGPPLADREIAVGVWWEAVSHVTPEQIEDKLGPPPTTPGQEAEKVPDLDEGFDL